MTVLRGSRFLQPALLLNFVVQREQFRILKRLFASQNNQRLLGYRTTSELCFCALRYNPPPRASRNRQRAEVRHAEAPTT
jgi:hypothetical protein